MIGEVALGGVYVPALLLLGIVAAIITGLLTAFLNLVGAYRLIAYRPLADVALFVLILGLLVLLTAPAGDPA